MPPSPRRKRPRRSGWTWLPSKSQAGVIVLLSTLSNLPGTWWASTKPDPQTAAAVSLGVTAAETQSMQADTIAALRRRMGSVERRLARLEGRGGKGSPGSADLAQPQKAESNQRGVLGFLSRWLGNRED